MVSISLPEHRRNIPMSKITFAFVLAAAVHAGAPAYAGDAKAEAARCTRWLDAVLLGDMDQAALVSTEQLNAEDVPKVYVDSQRANVTKLIDRLTKIGSGAPTFESDLGDEVVHGTGDIIKRQRWKFGANSRAYVGCVSYPGIDSPWHLVVKFEGNLDTLTTKLENAAKSHLSAPPER